MEYTDECKTGFKGQLSMLPFFTWVYSLMITIDPTLYIYVIVAGHSCYVVTSVQLAAHHFLGTWT